MIVALSDSVNHPLISEILDQSVHFNKWPFSTMRLTIMPTLEFNLAYF